MSRLRVLLLALLGLLVLMGASPVISSPVASALRTSGGTVLNMGAPTDGQVLCRSGSTVAGCAASGLASVACASPCTPGTGVATVTLTSTGTVNLPALSGYVDGQILRVVNDSTGAITVTLDPSDSGTLDGGSAGASAAYTVLAHGVVGAVRTSSSTWGSVQPGSVAVSRIVADISSGAFRAAGYASVAGSWIRVTGYRAPTYTQDPEGWGFSLNNADISLTTGAGVVNSVLRTEAPCWGWALSDFGVSSLANQRLGTIDASVTSITLTSAGTSDHHGVVGVYSTASGLSTGALYASGIGKPTTNYSWLKGPANGAPVAYSMGPNVRRVQAMHLIPLLSGADPYIFGYDSGGAILNAGGLTTANTATGTPTHFGVCLVRLTTPRAGTIAGVQVVFDLGSP